MNTLQLRFSIEEVAALLAVSGWSEMGQALLVSNFGELSSDELRGRMIAANHSLYARGHLVLKENKQQVAEETFPVIAALGQAKRTIRASKSAEFGEDLRVYYFYQDRWTENAVQDGVVYTFQSERSPEDIEAALSAFFTPVFLGWRKSEPVPLANTLLTGLPLADRRSPEAVLAFINQTASGHPYAQALAQDFAGASWRGSLVWVESESAGSLGMRGTLLVQGAERLWLINSVTVDGEPRMQAQLCSLAQFRQHIHDFVHSDQAPRREI